MTLAIIGGHVVDRPVRELTDADAHAVRAHLAADGVQVAVGMDIDQVVHIFAIEPVSTAQEVQALAAFIEVTDCRLAFHDCPKRVSK